MTIQSAVIPHNTIFSKHFTIAIQHGIDYTKISMKMNPNAPLHTSDCPLTKRILSAVLPNVLRTQCFNNDHLPFSREVKDTEMGHLLEHIMLEFLCSLKLARGFEEVDFSGTTSWNWVASPATYTIVINSGKEERDLIIHALRLSMTLVDTIIESKKTLQTQRKQMA